MIHRYGAAISWMVALVATIPTLAGAETISLSAASHSLLQKAIDAAAPGDTLVLEPGEFRGPVVIDRSITLRGEEGASIVGNDTGSVIRIKAADVVVTGLTISGSGSDLDTQDSGIFVEETAKRAVIERNRIVGNLHGVWLFGADDSCVCDNIITGTASLHMSLTGNGVSLWNSPGAKVNGNDISLGRDGIATNASKRNVFSGNRFRDLRFAIHYMYTHDSEISDNVSIGNSVGYAIMFSNKLNIRNNLSDGDRDHGLLLNYANYSVITGNKVLGHLQPEDRWTAGGTRSTEHGVPASDPEDAAKLSDGQRLGPEKCVFIYNANRNRFMDNHFENCAIGIHFTAGSEGNSMSGNAFINNRNQVKYVGTRYLDWSHEGRGNYWSDNPGFDLNGDGIADNPYRPNDLIDQVLWTAPQAKLLMTSPAVQVIRWAQAQFPAMLPGGVVDNHPLMTPTSVERSTQ